MKTRQPKRSRTERGPARRIEITDRDAELLLLTGLSGHIGVDQIARALFTSDDRCRRRVRLLFDAGYLSTLLVSSHAPALVRLTRKGLAFISERYPEVAKRIRLPGPIRLSGVEHRRGVLDARLYCAALGEKRGTPLVRWSNAGGELGRELGLDDLHLVPDGIGEWSTPGPVFIVVEIDRSTSGLTVIGKKLERYARAASSGLLDALWFVAMGGIGRQENLWRLIQAAGLSDWARVIPHHHLLIRPVRELPERTSTGAAEEQGDSPEYASQPDRTSP